MHLHAPIHKQEEQNLASVVDLELHVVEPCGQELGSEPFLETGYELHQELQVKVQLNNFKYSCSMKIKFGFTCCSTTVTTVWTTNIMVLGNADKKNKIEDHGKRVEEHLDDRVHFRPTTVIVSIVALVSNTPFKIRRARVAAGP